MSLNSQDLAPVKPFDIEAARIELEVNAHNERLEINALNVLLAVLLDGKGFKVLNKKYFDACKAALPGLRISAQDTKDMYESDTMRKIHVYPEGGKQFDKDSYARFQKGQNGYQPTRFYNLSFDLKTSRWMDSETYGSNDKTGIEIFQESISKRLTQCQNALTDYEDSLARLDAYYEQYNAAAAQIKALLEGLPEISYTVRSKYAPLAIK
jgi:hypothetical protein